MIFGLKRKVFVSYDHDDSDQANGFLGLRNLEDVDFDFINKKLDYEIQSKSDEYKRRVIRENFIKDASVTAVLIGVNYHKSKWSNWVLRLVFIEHILARLKEAKKYWVKESGKNSKDITY